VRSSNRTLPPAATIILVLWSTAGAQTPFTPAFEVNSDTSALPSNPTIATNSRGEFVVVWDSTRDFEHFDLRAQRYDREGRRTGSEMLVTEYTERLTRSDVAMDGEGNFVVVWGTNSLAGYRTHDSSVFARRFASEGSGFGSQIIVATAVDRAPPVLAMRSDGNFVVVWNRVDDSYHDEFRARHFDPGGEPVGQEFTIGHQPRFETKSGARIAADPAGGFAVVWAEYVRDRATDIFGQKYDWSGTTIGREFLVNTHRPDFQGAPDLAFARDGTFVIVWDSFQDGSETGIFGQRFAASSERLGGEFQVNRATLDYQSNPSVAFDELGRFVVAWSTHPDAPVFARSGSSSEMAVGYDIYGIFGRRFSRDGTPRGDEFRINPAEDQYPRHSGPEIASLAGRAFAVVWDTPGDVQSVFARRYHFGDFFCRGRHVTLLGTARADDLVGTHEADVLSAMGGNDTIRGLAGDDAICGGPGDDDLRGNGGDDTLDGTNGLDRLTGGRGSDACVTDADDDQFRSCETEVHP
jgi:hypothetical protein